MLSMNKQNVIYNKFIIYNIQLKNQDVIKHL